MKEPKLWLETDVKETFIEFEKRFGDGSKLNEEIEKEAEKWTNDFIAELNNRPDLLIYDENKIKVWMSLVVF